MGIYIHVPFCDAICSYCHFARTDRHGPELRARYAAAVVREFELRRRRCPLLAENRRDVLTCYLGGGTPSVLEPDAMALMLGGVLGDRLRATGFELTAEANPESLTADVAEAWRAMGVERVSLGVQSLEPEVLRLLGRRCEPDTARAALALTGRIFPRVSADWIVGPGLQKPRLLDELSEAVDLGVAHFSVYILELHAGTKLSEQVARGEVAMLPDRRTEELYLAVVDHLQSLGLVQYEVANFARPGQESRHNRNYWRHRPWLGLGPGAHGYWGRRRYANHEDLQRWLRCVDDDVLPEASVDQLDRPAIRLERLILGLRTTAGVAVDRLPPGALDLARGQAEDLWTVRGGRLRLTARGFLRIDTIEERLARLTL